MRNGGNARPTLRFNSRSVSVIEACQNSRRIIDNHFRWPVLHVVDQRQSSFAFPEHCGRFRAWGRISVCMSDSQSQFELTEADFLRLFVKHEAALRAYARAIVPDWDLIDEALQEASITMWQKREQLREASGFVPWAKTVLRFKCLRQLEKLRTQRPLLSEDLLETIAERAERRSADGSTTQSQALQTCFSQFSQQHQELLLAPHSSTHTVVDLAKRRNKSPNALYKLLARLRKQLNECVNLRISGEVN